MVCWRVVKGDMAKIDAFHNGCLSKICRICWPNKISNVDLYKKTGCNSAVLEIKRRQLRWLGHVLRMPGDSIPKVALRWTPPGKRKRGRPKMTWRQTVMAELRETGLSWGEAQASAKDKNLVAKDCCGLMSHWGRRGKVKVTSHVTHYITDIASSVAYD